MNNAGKLKEKEIEDNKQSPGEKIYAIAQNRELSWLKFNERVLRIALDPLVPLYEKLKFISIFVSNLTEFYMIRVGSLTDQSLLKNPENDNKTGMSPKEQLNAIFKETKDLSKVKDQIYFSVSQAMKEWGIWEAHIEDLSKTDLREVQSHYRHNIEPILSPMIIDTYHPFPFIENQQFCVVAEISNEMGEKIALLPIPKYLKPILHFKNANGIKYILTEQIIKYYFQDIYHDWQVKNTAIICVTRNADLTMESEILDEDLDYKDSMKKILKKRNRLQPVRLETDTLLSKKLQEFLCRNLNIEPKQIFVVKSPMKMKYVFDLSAYMSSAELESLSFYKFEPQINPHLNMSKPLLPQIKSKDIMFIYPYEDIGQFVELLNQAAEDPDVLSIKITIYRLDTNSKIAYNLMKAAENGKEVTVLMELRARFDEQNNIDYSDEFIKSGINVIYGIENFKCHSKICLITKKGENGIEYITQVGTGNYNESTSKQYTDISLITADSIIAKDAVDFFNDMQMGDLNGEYKKLLVAPHTLKPKLLELMDEEIKKGKDGRIFFKCNSLTDKEFILKLSEASQQSVDVKLLIRGICCLVPGIKGLTDNIEVRSIVGRYLEHPRIYIFGEGEDAKYYISSADLMTRNTTRRVEVAAPVEDEKLKRKLRHYIDYQWRDNQKARVLLSNKNYDRIYSEDALSSLSSQDYMMEYAISKVTDYKEEERKEEKKTFFQKIAAIFKK